MKKSYIMIILIIATAMDIAAMISNGLSDANMNNKILLMVILAPAAAILSALIGFVADMDKTRFE